MRIVLFLVIFLSCEQLVRAQVNLHALYSDVIRVEHRGTDKDWNEENILKEQQEIIADYEKSRIQYFGRNVLVPAIAYGYCGKPKKPSD